MEKILKVGQAVRVNAHGKPYVGKVMWPGVYGNGQWVQVETQFKTCPIRTCATRIVEPVEGPDSSTL